MNTLTKVIIRVDGKAFQEIILSTDKKKRDLILEIERKVEPHKSFNFCEPLVRSKLGFKRGKIEYIQDKRVQDLTVISLT